MFPWQNHLFALPQKRSFNYDKALGKTLFIAIYREELLACSYCGDTALFLSVLAAAR